MRITLFLIVVLLICGVAMEGDAVTITEKGVAKAVIVVAGDASKAERHAASELGTFLGRVTGAKFEIVNKTVAGKSNLLVGPKAAIQVDPGFSTEGLGDEGIVIRTAGNNLILAGGHPRGTLYAVYTFLEDHVGCHWWTPTESTIPKKPDLAVGNLNIRYVPVLEYRDTSYFHAKDGDFSVRNKYNGQNHRLFIDDGFHNVVFDTKLGGRKYAYIKNDKWSSHGFWTLIPPEVYFDDHPEWYSLINGERTHKVPHYFVSSLCLSNEEMREEIVKNIRLALCWNPHATIISVAQPDDSGPPNRCQCARCVAIEQEGNPSELMIRFVNGVATDLEKHLPDMLVSTLAYHYTQKPPKTTRARHNVVVRLSSIKCSFSRPMTDERNRMFTDDLAGWSKMCNLLHVWDYVVNFTSPLLPHPNLRVLGPNIRFFIDLDVKGIFAEAIASGWSEMAELRAWMLAKLMWDPYLNTQELIKQFCDGYYGPAGKHVIAYLDVIHNAVEVTDDWLGLSSPPTAKFLSFDTLQRGWAHLNVAETAVRDDPKLHSRVQVAQLPVMFAFMYSWDELREKCKAVGADWPMPDSMNDTMKQFLKIARRKGITNLHEIPMPQKMLTTFKEN